MFGGRQDGRRRRTEQQQRSSSVRRPPPSPDPECYRRVPEPGEAEAVRGQRGSVFRDPAEVVVIDYAEHHHQRPPVPPYRRPPPGPIHYGGGGGQPDPIRPGHLPSPQEAPHMVLSRQGHLVQHGHYVPPGQPHLANHLDVLDSCSTWQQSPAPPPPLPHQRPSSLAPVVSLQDDLAVTSEVTIMRRAGHHHHHHEHQRMPQYPPDPAYLNQHHVPPPPHKNSGHSSRCSDTSSAYSGSDTMQALAGPGPKANCGKSVSSLDSGNVSSHGAGRSSYGARSMHSSLDNDPVDLSGLHESVVDSDEDLAESVDSLAIRDPYRDCLEKDPLDRTTEDIENLLEFTQQLPAFCNLTLATRKALCAVMVFAVVEKAGTVVMNDGEELDSWSVIINGEVRVDDGINQPLCLSWGDAFGIEPTMEKRFHKGVMRTVQDDCQFVCITQNDYYKILNEEHTNQRRYEEDGEIVLVTEPAGKIGGGHKVLRGTPERLLAQLIDENSSSGDASYVEDFLLTHRTFMNDSLKVAEKLLQWFQQGILCDRVTRVLLLWVHNHFTDFETSPSMMLFLEKFERALNNNNMNGQIRMLNFTCAEKARKRTVRLTRPSREDPLQFDLIGGQERGFGIFVDKVESGSKAEDAGIKRGDQILEVNKQSFEHTMTLQRAIIFLKDSTLMEMTVKSNLLVFKELRQTPDTGHPSRAKLRKASGSTGLHSSNQEYDTKDRKLRSRDDTSGIPRTPWNSSSSIRSANSSSSSLLQQHAVTGKERIKAVLRGLMKPRSILSSVDAELPNLLGITTASDHADTSSSSWDLPVDLPEHSLKIYRGDGHFRFLLVHAETSARQVVMLALREFGVLECSSNFTLCEVTVEGGFVRQKRLPDDQTHLANRIGLASRYYVKNVSSSEQLLNDEASKAELAKESAVNLLQLNAVEVAMQLMVEDFTVFRAIEPTEYIDKLMEIESRFGTPNLTKFGELVNTEMMWVITEIVSEANVNRRAKIIKQFIKIAHHCFKDTQNYNAMFAITSGLDHGAVKRLRATWEKVPAKYHKILSEMQMVMDPSMNFRKYRNLISNARPPFIPIYPMVNKDLTFIHLGNETLVEGLINFEKLRMLAKEIKTLTNMCSVHVDIFTLVERQGTDVSTMRLFNAGATGGAGGATLKRANLAGKKAKEALNPKRMYEEAQMVRRVKTYLNKMPVLKDEDALHKMSAEVEPGAVTAAAPTAGPQASASKPLASHGSSASLGSLAKKPSRGRTSPTPSVGSNASSSTSAEGAANTRKVSKFEAEVAKTVQDLPQVEAREVAVTTSSFEDVEEKKMTKIWGKLERSKLAAALLLEGLFAEKRAKICSLQHQGEEDGFDSLSVTSEVSSTISTDDEEGTVSPQSVRKMMSLSEPPKTRKQKSRPQSPTRKLSCNPDPSRKVSGTSAPSLTKESSSVTNLRKASSESSKGSAESSEAVERASRPPQPPPASRKPGKPMPKLGGRTLSRERKKSEKRGSGGSQEGQISAV